MTTSSSTTSEVLEVDSSMDWVTAHHEFGRTEIGGNAVVQQGDKHVGQIVNTFHIAQAYITLQNELDLPQVGLTPGTKRPRDKSIEHKDNYCERFGKRRKAGDLAPRFRSTEDGRQTESRRTESKLAYTREPIEPSRTSIARAASAGEPQRHLLLHLLQRIYDRLSSPLLSRFTLRKSPTGLDAWHAAGCTSNDNDGTALATRQQADPVRELAVLCIVLMSCLIYRNVSGKEVSRVLARCQQDQILPLLSTLLGFGIARYLYLGQIGRSLTGVSGDCIILEDAFRKERFVPLSTCEDFSILKAFLDVHYRGTTAEVFIKTGRFNMMLGSRRGPVIRETDWSSQGRIKARQRVVMAVYCVTDVKKCIHCTSGLTLTGRGEFICMSCQSVTTS
ncbi:hypothetical protein LTR70_005571 [Exophiala xenobiotica]|uniref:Ubiquitin-like domain-containing protein n=1 Tax=Lithohypha guttulata TaxID=1690604 RepID=A0ABR0K9V8_9EURO|nr:hypothetical protein LTR24_005212 [Lithohypha guttulata]KAK5318087.1 hypothetical protein LTR70_005571 [Exophiala xenobiotica]